MIQLKITIKGNKLILDNDKIIYLTKEMFSKFDLKDKTELDDETFYSLICWLKEIILKKN